MLESKNALVTGGSSGIGKATAEKLGKKGANVAIAARSEEKLEQIADSISLENDVETLAVPTDVSSEKQVKRMVEATVDEFGSLDIVVNNAGLGVGDSVEEMETENYRKMMDVNCDGMFFTARETVPYLKETEGNLVFVASFAGKYPRPGNPVYAATKWWTRGFAMSLSGQIGDEDVAVTTVNPTEVRTEFASESGSSFSERFDEGEVTEPEDVAEAIIFAVKQEKPNMVNELDVYRRDKFTDF